ncbi:unnamed protein product [Candidula unifasciata]|uniref:Uncharacterized protein n=1 Tax=Candidula unifasciata TaxID=100452 RepID=A0A8S3YJ18_9EUPU|nr:unnamed protein product [Candidula unifasciata]
MACGCHQPTSVSRQGLRSLWYLPSGCVITVSKRSSQHLPVWSVRDIPAQTCVKPPASYAAVPAQQSLPEDPQQLHLPFHARQPILPQTIPFAECLNLPAQSHTQAQAWPPTVPSAQQPAVTVIFPAQSQVQHPACLLTMSLAKQVEEFLGEPNFGIFDGSAKNLQPELQQEHMPGQQLSTGTTLAQFCDPCWPQQDAATLTEMDFLI